MKIKLYQVAIEGTETCAPQARYWDFKPHDGATSAHLIGEIEIEVPDLPDADAVAAFLAPLKAARIEALKAELAALENAA